MCFDAQTSIVTFCIGTALNIYNIVKYNNKVVTAISLLWEWVLLMQLFDFFAWRNQPKNNKGNSTNKYAAKGAFIANVTQPIILSLLLLSSVENPTEHKVIAALTTFCYTCWTIYSSNKIPEVETLTPSGDCSNLRYHWWDDMGTVIPYMVTLVVVILLLVKPTTFAVLQLTFIMTTLLISFKYYSCGTGSVWCWFAAFAPLLVGPMWEYSN